LYKCSLGRFHVFEELGLVPFRTALKKLLLVILGLLTTAGAALVHWGPVRKYVIECERVSDLICTVERSEATGTRRWRFQFSPDTAATIRIVPRRRSSDDVYLYLRSAEHEVFAAQFESLDGVREAEAAAAQLNQLFQSTLPAKTRVEVRPPAYFRWLSWGALSFMVLLIAVAYRKQRFDEQRTNNQYEPTSPGSPT